MPSVLRACRPAEVALELLRDIVRIVDRARESRVRNTCPSVSVDLPMLLAATTPCIRYKDQRRLSGKSASVTPRVDREKRASRRLFVRL